MAIPLHHRLIDVVCPQGHIVSIVTEGEPLPVIYTMVRSVRTLTPSYAIAAAGLEPVIDVTGGGQYYSFIEHYPSVQVGCADCQAIYTLDHSALVAGLALPAVNGRTRRITIQRVKAAKPR